MKIHGQTLDHVLRGTTILLGILLKEIRLSLKIRIFPPELVINGVHMPESQWNIGILKLAREKFMSTVMYQIQHFFLNWATCAVEGVRDLEIIGQSICVMRCWCGSSEA